MPELDSPNLTNTAKTSLSLDHYYAQLSQLATLKNTGAYSRKTIHDLNNALGKINNALWLMAREDSASSPFFKQCQQIIEQELISAHTMLGSDP